MSKTLNRQGYRRGAVSLYIVIFTTLLISIITISFIRIMLSEQDSATNADLSQSAYDSALAGVEDAKVVLVKYQNCINSNSTSSGDCGKIITAVNSDDCDTIYNAVGIGEQGKETIIQTGNNDSSSSLNQAYTCVKIDPNTGDFLGTLQPNQSRFIPLRYDTAASAPTHIRLSWFMRDNSDGEAIDRVDIADIINANRISESLLPRNEVNDNNWPANRPSLMRFQLMQTAGTFTLGQFNESNADVSNRGTLFLYPSTSGVVSDNGLINSALRTNNAPTPVFCNESLGDHPYACEVIIKIPPTVGGGSNAATSMLKLTGFYNEADFRVEMCSNADCSETVQFYGVQPEVDSTGRANDLFRRVISRIEMVDIYFPLPEYEVQLGGDSLAPLCKNFYVTDEKGKNLAPSNCPQ